MSPPGHAIAADDQNEPLNPPHANSAPMAMSAGTSRLDNACAGVCPCQAIRIIHRPNARNNRLSGTPTTRRPYFCMKGEGCGVYDLPYGHDGSRSGVREAPLARFRFARHSAQ